MSSSRPNDSTTTADYGNLLFPSFIQNHCPHLNSNKGARSASSLISRLSLFLSTQLFPFRSTSVEPLPTVTK